MDPHGPPFELKARYGGQFSNEKARQKSAGASFRPAERGPVCLMRRTLSGGSRASTRRDHASKGRLISGSDLTTALAALVFLLQLPAFPSPAQFPETGPLKVNRQPRVYVIAVRTIVPSLKADSDERAAKADGRTVLERPAPELNLFAPRDPAIEAAVCQEFRKRKKITVVDGPEQADVVLIVEGGYGFFFGHRSYSGSFSAITFAADDPAAPNTLLQLKAAAIPAPHFRALPGRESLMSQVVRWRGREGEVTRLQVCNKSSIGKLVGRFQKELLR